MYKSSSQRLWFFMLVIITSMSLVSCGGIEFGVETPAAAPEVTSLPSPELRQDPTRIPDIEEIDQNTPLMKDTPVAGWLGYVVSLPEGGQFDDYLVVDGSSEFGLEGATPDIQAQVVALRDKEEPGKYANFWGTLTCDVPDYKGCQLVVTRVRSGMEVTEPEQIEAWQGTIVSLDPPAQFDDAFVLVGDYPVRFGIASGIAENGWPVYAEELTARRDSENTLQVWGQMICGVPDVNGCQIQVERMLDNQDPVSPYEGWMQYQNEVYGFSFYYPPAWSLEETPERVLAEGEPVSGNILRLIKEEYVLTIGYKRVGEERIFWTGIPAGEFESRGYISFFGHQMEKEALFLEGKLKVVTFPFTAAENLVFAIRLEDRSSDYLSVDLPGAIQDEVDQILGSFEHLK